MTVEILFPEVCGLFGDRENAGYLRQALPQAQFVETPLTETPYFAREDPDLVLIGSMTEHTQERVLEKLRPLKARLLSLVEKGTPILATGNACDLFAEKIEYVTEERRAEGLGVFPLTVRTDLFARYNGKVLGTFENMEIVGFRSQFSFLYGDNSGFAFLTCQRGIGIHPGSRREGMRKNHLFCTQLIGPLLPLNPLFCEYLLRLAGVEPQLPFREAAMAAYEQRRKEFHDPKTAME